LFSSNRGSLRGISIVCGVKIFWCFVIFFENYVGGGVNFRFFDQLFSSVNKATRQILR